MTRIFSGASADVALLEPLRATLAVRDNMTFGWSSGCFAALRESGAERLFLYEPPYGAERDASLVQRLEFVRMLAWRPFSIRRARAAFWRMVTQRAEGGNGFDDAPFELQERLVSAHGSFVRELFSATGRDVAPRSGVRLAIGSRSAAPMRRAVERLSLVLNAPVDVLEGLDHLAPLTRPEAIAAWISAHHRA